MNYDSHNAETTKMHCADGDCTVTIKEKAAKDNMTAPFTESSIYEYLAKLPFTDNLHDMQRRTHFSFCCDQGHLPCLCEDLRYYRFRSGKVYTPRYRDQYLGNGKRLSVRRISEARHPLSEQQGGDLLSCESYEDTV